MSKKPRANAPHHPYCARIPPHHLLNYSDDITVCWRRQLLDQLDAPDGTYPEACEGPCELEKQIGPSCIVLLRCLLMTSPPCESDYCEVFALTGESCGESCFLIDSPVGPTSEMGKDQRGTRLDRVLPGLIEAFASVKDGIPPRIDLWAFDAGVLGADDD